MADQRCGSEGVQGQVGWGLEHPGLRGGDPAMAGEGMG